MSCFDKVLEISASDIAGVEGYGEFNEDCKTEYSTCRQYLIDTFAEDKEGYWFNWKELYDTTILDRDFVENIGWKWTPELIIVKENVIW